MILTSIMNLVPIKVIGYNPLSMNCEDRVLDIMEEMQTFDIVLVAGTGKKAILGEGTHNKVHKGATMFSSGYEVSMHSNKSCGTAIMIGKRLPKARFHPIDVAPAPITGREMAMIISSRWADFTAIVAYFPPVPWVKEKCTI